MVETVPGITAMQDLAARSGTVLCEGTESLALLPLTAGVPAFEEALKRLTYPTAKDSLKKAKAFLESS